MRRLKLDENLPAEAAVVLRDAGHDAVTILDQNMAGDPDSDVARVCRAEDRAVVTLDLDFADIRTYPPADYPGIIVMRPVTQSKPAVLQLVKTLLVAFELGEPLEGHLWVLRENGLRIR